MLPIAYYLLKVIICSGILYGYYWLLLRNKVFHKYNRFYLMVSVVLSMLLPLIKIDFWQQHTTRQAGVIKVLQAVSNGNEYMDNIIVTAKKHSFNTEQLYPIAYLAITFIFLAIFMHTLYCIFNLLKKYPKQVIDKVAFINTDAKSTPFTFLNFIFWNNNIDLHSTTGKQIFKHELAHVEEKHTYDKLFINIVLILFWCNPFYWLHRKELNMIHEFIADNKAVEDSDTAAFAAMILQATYPQHRFQLTNNFFYSPIKRRLLMLTKNKNPKVNYFGRIMVLPLLIVLVTAFTIKLKNTGEEKRLKPGNTITGENLLAIQLKKDSQYKDTVPVSVYINTKFSDTNYLKTKEYRTKALVITDGVEKGNVGMDYVEKNWVNNSSIVIFNPTEAKKIYGDKGKYGVIQMRQKSVKIITADAIIYDQKNKELKLKGNNSHLEGDFSDALIYVDGKVVTPESLNLIAPEKIQSINLIKGERLDDIMDAKGKKAVINVTLKPENLKEVVVTGNKKPEPLYVIDGAIKDENFNLNNISPDVIEKIDVLKGKSAIEKYGEKGRNGVMEIRLKPNEKSITSTEIINESPILAAIAADKMNVLYIGIDNPITIAVPTIKPEDLVPHISSGRITGSNGKYNVNVFGSNDVTITLTKKDGSKIPGVYLFKVKRIPDPNDDISYKNGEYKIEPELGIDGVRKVRMPAEQIKKAKKLTAGTGYEVSSAIVYFSGEGFKNVSSASLSGDDLTKLNELINKCVSGSVITFDNVKVKGDNGYYSTIDGLSISLYNDIDKNIIFTKTEVEPSFSGGDEEWRKFLIKNLDPAIPEQDSWKAGTYTVLVKFIVHTDGTVSDVITTNYQKSKTAQHCINLIKNSQGWNAAVQNGRKVNAYRMQPITFLVK